MKNNLHILIFVNSSVLGQWLEKRITASFKKAKVKIVTNENTFSKARSLVLPDLIIVDCLHPKINFLDLYRDHKQRCPSVPIIIYTNLENEKVAIKYLQNTVDDYVLKEHIDRLKFTMIKTLNTYEKEAKYNKIKNELEKEKDNVTILQEKINRLQDNIDQRVEEHTDIINNIFDGYYVASIEGELQEYNHVFPRIFGLDHKKNHSGLKLESLMQNKGDMLSFIGTLKKKRTIKNYILHAKKINGEQIILKINSQLLKSKTKKPTGFVGTAIDISEQIKTNQKTLLNERFLTALLNSYPEKIYFKDKKSRFIKTSLHYAKLFGGNSIEYFKNKTDFDLYDKKHARAAYKDEQHIINTGKSIINRIEKESFENGSMLYVSTTKMPLYNQDREIIGTFGISRDITKQKQSEKKLKVNARELKHKNKIIQKLNIELEGKIKERTDELTKRKIELEESNEQLYKSHKAALSIMQDAEIQKKKVEQTLKYLEINTTELKKLSKAIDKSPVSVIITNRDGIIEYVNPVNYKTTGYTIEEMIGKKTNILKSGFHKDDFYKKMWTTINTGKVWTGELLNKKKDGTPFWEKTSISSITNESGEITHFVAVKEDVTQRKQIEEEKKFFSRFQTLITHISTTFINLKFEDIDKQINTALKEITSFVNADIGYVFMFSDNNKSYALTHNYSSVNFILNKNLLQSVKIDKESDSLNKLLAGKIITYSNIEKSHQEAIFIKRTFLSHSVKSLVAVPLIYNRLVIGFLGLNTIKKTRNWKSDEKNLLKLIGTIFVNAIKRKQSQDELIQEKKFSETVLQSLPGIFTSTSDDRKFVRWNENFEKFTGYSSKKILKMDPFKIVYKEDIPKATQYMQTVIKNGFDTSELRLIDSKGTIIPYFITSVKVQIGEINYLISNAFDISDRLKMEAELKTSKEIAEAATLAKSKFLAVMSHEIRTPMNAIMGFSNLALKTDLNDKQLDYIIKIENSAQTLLGIIDDILDFSKIEAGKLEIEAIEFELNVILRNVANIINVKAHEKNLEVILKINHDVPLNLIGDPLRLEQVLLNLANNAIKFTESGEIVIYTELLYLENNNAIIKFSVMDTGIGIIKGKENELFQPFIQGELSTSRQYGGAGLGLSISRHLVNLMGGDIKVDSRPGHGSNFSFTIYLKVNDKPAQKFILPSADLKGIKILVVDKNKTLCKTISDYLKYFSFKPRIADSAEQAIKEIKKSGLVKALPYDLIIMDWRMPGMDGLSAAKQLKNDPKFKIIPIIIMIDGLDREALAASKKETCIDRFLVKPVTASSLFDSIIEIFGYNKEKRDIPNNNKKYSTKLDSIRGARLLLVEDNEFNRQVAIELLESEGFFITIANDGNEALKKLDNSRNKAFDLVLMDLQMPVMDGYEATKKIRKNKRFENLPIVAMTADAVVGIKQKCLNIGMNDYITKPIDPEKMLNTLIKWIKPGKRKINQTFNKKTKPNIPLQLSGVEFLNIDKGINRLNGNVDVYSKIIVKFKDNNQKTFQSLKKNLETNNLKKAEFIVHNIKGVAGNIGADNLFKASDILNTLLKENNTKKIHGALNDFKVELDNVLKSITEYEKKLNTNKKIKKIPKEKKLKDELNYMLPVLNQLCELLVENNIRAKDTLRKLIDKSRSKEMKELNEVIMKELDVYNFEDALEYVKSFLKKYKE